ncbi:MAG TPA: HDOD domain-containing protein [Candidatus Didemnitutus sp.]|nr:HDOD domain-containing protein [Candidatus Didemnitutus sp.]
MSIGRETIISIGSGLPPAMGIFGRLRGLLDNPNTDIDDIVKLLRIDTALTFQVIKLANSALYGIGQRCESLEEAVARVGFGEIHQIVGLVVARQAFQKELSNYQTPGGRLWENAVAAGTLMGALAEVAGGDSRNAYSTGLLRNIGRIVLNNYPGAVKYPGEDERPNVFDWEREVHGMIAPEVSATLLDHWRFAPATVMPVRHHYKPENGGSHKMAAAQLHMACALTAEWGCALPGEGTVWRSDASVLEMAGIDENYLQGAVDLARVQFNRFAVIQWSQT